MGVQPKNEFDLKKWWSVDGRPPRNGDELVAGSAAAAALACAPAPPSASDGRPFTVTGILRPTGSQDDDLLITDLGTAQGVLAQAGQGLDDPGRGAVQRLPGGEDRRASSAACCPGTKVTAMQDKVKNRMHAIDQFRSFSWVVAGVIIGIEALVVFVTMMGSVNERTREIGIFRALGFRRLHVTRPDPHRGGRRQPARRRARLPRRHGA